jgi:hypothetical protein
VSSKIFLAVVQQSWITDPREARCSVPTVFLSQKGFSAFRRFALLPFALLVERFAPVPVGVLHFYRGCYLSAELIRLPSLACGRSAATTQSPELGDSQHNPFPG